MPAQISLILCLLLLRVLARSNTNVDRPCGAWALYECPKNSIFSQILFVANDFEYMQYVGSAAAVADICVLSSHDCPHAGVMLLLFGLTVRCLLLLSSSRP